MGTPDGSRQVLAGGVANAGAVVREGDVVSRPAPENWRSIHGLLTAIRADGFDGAPQVAGAVTHGRERFRYIAGDVALPPYPGWARSDAALASVATLLRRLHDATASYGWRGGTWSDDMRDPHDSGDDAIVCHNDVCLENVVFRDGRAVAFLDFDFAAPGRRVFDVAQFARMCVPIDHDANAARLGWEPTDRARRLRIVADAYGLTAPERSALIGTLGESIDAGEAMVRRKVDAGDPNFIAMWNDLDGATRYERRRAWFTDHRTELADALS